MRTDLNPGTQPFTESNRTSSQSQVSADAHSSMDENQAQLSGRYIQIRALAAQAAKLPEVGLEKVGTLRQMVLGGSYQPNSEQVAEALFMQMLVKPSV